MVPQRPATERTQTLKEALATAHTILNPQDRAQALAVIALQLPETQHTRILNAALSAAGTIYESP